jgi:hypothetical protein
MDVPTASYVSLDVVVTAAGLLVSYN